MDGQSKKDLEVRQEGVLQNNGKGKILKFQKAYGGIQMLNFWDLELLDH